MPIITLTTDLGLQDFYVAKLKSSILKHQPQAQFLDINHSIQSHDIQQAAYNLMNIWQDLPPKSIHLIAVYNHYSAKSEFVVFEKEGHFFIGPNNGVFTLIFPELVSERVHKIDSSLESVFGTYAHAIALLTTGAPLDDIGPELEGLNQKINILPVYTSSEIRATIIHVDHYGNAVLNVNKQFFNELRKGRNFEIFFKNSDPITKIHTGYSQTQVGDVLALFNLNDFLEIAINMGNASTMLDLYKNETIQIHFKEDKL